MGSGYRKPLPIFCFATEFDWPSNVHHIFFLYLNKVFNCF